jgi:putative sugar O-methyltransferase
MLSDLKPASQDAELEAMFAEIDSAGPLFHPSKLWERLAREHAREIDKYGLGQLKKTLGMRYFNFALPGIIAQSLLPAFRDWLRQPAGNPLAARMAEDRPAPPELKYAGAIGKLYAIYVELLYDQTAARDGERLLEKIGDQPFGGPHLVRLSNGKTTSQDLCNSLYEFYSVMRGNGAIGAERPIIEVGAGYGRLAYIFLRARPGCKSWIVDLPPALYASQVYLSTVLPYRKVFAFRHFDDYREVAA